METIILGIAGLVSHWVMLFCLGRILAGGHYLRPMLYSYLVGLACWFGNLALSPSPDFSMTTQELGVLGLFLMAYSGSSVGGGYLFEKKFSKKEVER
jgi:hypothetical protein